MMAERTQPIDRFAKIHNLLGVAKEWDYKAVMTSLSKFLNGFSGRGTFAVNFEKGGRYAVKLADKRAVIEENSRTEADFDIYIEEQTAQKIAMGIMSPIFALGREKMRISGNTSLAISVYEKLAADKGIIDPCRRR
jgi:hypothetical protein